MTSWPRLWAAERSLCVLYERGARDKIASFTKSFQRAITGMTPDVREATRVTTEQNLTTVAGWREWASLPDLGIPWVKVKLDTGARSSAIHAHDIELIDRDGERWARFEIHPWQRSDNDARRVELPVIDDNDRPLGILDITDVVSLTESSDESMTIQITH